jgi:hypothetical protein
MATQTNCWRRARRMGRRARTDSPREPLPAEAFSTLLTHAEYQRLLGSLGAAVRDGALTVDDDRRAELAELADRHRTDVDVVTQDVEPVLERLAALGLIVPVL